MQVYLAGPLFSVAERGYLGALPARIRALQIECFVPHEAKIVPLTPANVFRTDHAALLASQALVAWLDGPSVDDGTACEIGIFSELARHEPTRRKGILGLATDLRLHRRRPDLGSAGMNLFVAGAIEATGRICWNEDEVLSQLRAWNSAP